MLNFSQNSWHIYTNLQWYVTFPPFDFVCRAIVSKGTTSRIRSLLVSSMTKSGHGQSEPVSIQLARCRAFIFLDFCAVCLEGTFRPHSSLFFSSTIALLRNKPAGPTRFYASDAAVLFHFTIHISILS